MYLYFQIILFYFLNSFCRHSQSSTPGPGLSSTNISNTQNPILSRRRRSWKHVAEPFQNDEQSSNVGANGVGEELSSLGWFASSNASNTNSDDQIKTKLDFEQSIGFKNFDYSPPLPDEENHLSGSAERKNPFRVEGTFHSTTAKPSERRTLQVNFIKIRRFDNF